MLKILKKHDKRSEMVLTRSVAPVMLSMSFLKMAKLKTLMHKIEADTNDGHTSFKAHVHGALIVLALFNNMPYVAVDGDSGE